ncbi:MAG: GNAT family N-acetyltransferase [Pseudomonadota bacterium]|nr:GNAT family N-acetyltransferase [Pseudomonadota bacterium]
MSVDVRRATLDDLDIVAPLFNQYRVFYEQASDIDAARDFLGQRMQAEESVVLLAMSDGRAAGFTQLYPMFSSVRLARVWILNDLFVAPVARRLGVASALLDAAQGFAREAGALRLELETAHDNLAAQTLYRDVGWESHDETLRFRISLCNEQSSLSPRGTSSGV